MKLLITGICGFVGSTLAIAWKEAFPGDDVIGIDNLSRYGSWVNRQSLLHHGVVVHHGDIRCPSDLEAIGGVDWIIDSAANPSVLAGVDGRSSSRQLVEHNLSGTINLLEHCKRYAAGFILLSTSRVYSIKALADLEVTIDGNAFVPKTSQCIPGVSEHGISESFPTTSPVSLYGATKLASEQLALEYGSAFRFPVWINRCGVMAGAGQFGKVDQGIFAFWLHSWNERRPLRYIGFDGRGCQVRDCMHPRDLLSLLQKQVSESPESVKPRVLNVSGGIESAMSLAQLSEWCTLRWGECQVGVDLQDRHFDVPWLVLDNRQAKEVWDWSPEISTQEILAEIAGFAVENPNWLTVSGSPPPDQS